MSACFNYLCVIKSKRDTWIKKNDIFQFFKKSSAVHRLHSTVICHINHDKVDDLGTFKACKRFISANEPRIHVFEIFRKRKEDCNLQ